MRTIKLTIEYDGANYAGWQIQPNGVTVQETLENALNRLLGEPVRLRSSGRTDAGVHALTMVAAFTTERNLPLSAFVGGCNRFLPPDIAIVSAVETSPDFQPIRDARTKHYRYTIYNAPVRSPMRRFYSWHVREKLDLDAMTEAAKHFTGRHDFAAFCASNHTSKTTVRHIDSITISRQEKMIFIDIIGEGFLKNMVRVMAGTLVDIGRGRFDASHIVALLKTPDRKKAGVTAPAFGLCLMEVVY